jgi:hypothetical protein
LFMSGLISYLSSLPKLLSAFTLAIPRTLLDSPLTYRSHSRRA